jgi:ABC-type antimicrobial peptide transport system permease subunit
MSHGARLAAIGLGIGLVLALGFARALSRMLFGVGALDPITFGATAIVILALALVASYLPALRATRIDPVVALREE